MKATNDIHFLEPVSDASWSWLDVTEEALTRERIKALGISEEFLSGDAGMSYSSPMLRELEDYVRMQKAYAKAAHKIVHEIFFSKGIMRLMRKRLAPRINEHKRAAKAMKAKRARTGRRRK